MSKDVIQAVKEREAAKRPKPKPKKAKAKKAGPEPIAAYTDTPT